MCPDVAATSLAHTWDNPPADSASLRLLGEISGTISDRSLLEKATEIATDAGRSPEQRLAAMRTLAAYAVPGTMDPGRYKQPTDHRR